VACTRIDRSISHALSEDRASRNIEVLQKKFCGQVQLVWRIRKT
jgi:hypothetical protein